MILFKRHLYLLKTKWKIFLSYRSSVKVKKFLLFIFKLINIPFILPFALFLHFLGYRVVNIFTDRIGHLAIEPDCVLKDLILKKSTIKKLILLAPKNRVSNEHLLKYWYDFFMIIRNPLICYFFNLISLTLFAKLDVSKYTRTLVSPNDAYRVYRDWGDKPYLLKLKDDDFKWGWDILTILGVPSNAWFVCVHVRDASFSPVDSFLHSHRNGDLKNLDLAIEEIVNRGGWVIRIGFSGSIFRNSIKLKQYIDYPSSQFVSDRMDIFLCAQAKFILGNTSGIALVGSIFGTPCALANMTPITATGFNPMDISFPKLHWSQSKKKYINLEEINKLNLLDARTASEFNNHKVILIENSPEDIRDLCIEMFSNLEIENYKSNSLLTVNQIFKDFKNNQIYSNGSPAKFSHVLINKYKDLF